MDTVVASHTTALRAIRYTRRRSYLLPWREVDEHEQRRALSACSPAARALDWDLLAYNGMVDADKPLAHILVADPCKRRNSTRVSCHVAAATLPPRSLLRSRNDVYVASPALCCLQYAETHSLIQTLALVMELCGTFSMHETLPDDEQADEGENDGYSEAEQALTLDELGAYLACAVGMRGAAKTQRALRYALEGARSPMEAIMAAQYHLPFSLGGFGCRPMLLNYKLPFTRQARAASGMPYAVCDAYLPSARVDLEYNSGHHDGRGARLHDERRSAGLSALGVQTIVVNNEQLRNVEALEAISQTIYQRAGKRFQNRTKGSAVKQLDLLNELRKCFGLKAC